MQIVSGGRACVLAKGPLPSDVARTLSKRPARVHGAMWRVCRSGDTWTRLLYFGRLDIAVYGPPEHILCVS